MSATSETSDLSKSKDQSGDDSPLTGFWARLRGRLRGRNGDNSLRDTIEEIIEETEREEQADIAIGSHERVMLGNILKLRHLTAYDVMVPRADIAGVDISAPLDEVIAVTSGKGHSRVPVYRGNLDDVVGFVHIKDVLAAVKSERKFSLAGLTRGVLFVAPSMRVLDLLLQMRLSRVHLALVVDEFGGTDGLITIEDLVEEIVGEIEDEHDAEAGPRLVRWPDGSLVADARVDVDEFEEAFGQVLTQEEREEDIDTLGGLVATIAGRVPTRGELILHSSGVSFEVMEADPRRIKRLRVRRTPSETESADDAVPEPVSESAPETRQEAEAPVKAEKEASER
ncbi:MAG: hemolysin family protein [Kiloniellales bacterium]|nr:hemolysin family protein [Kiloniellales bacterium]MDJ0980365.1 hemolysin family protein [Kiloniellales bacterium]